MKNIELNYLQPFQLQEQTLFSNLNVAKNTIIGKQFDFTNIKNYEQFKARIPVFNYESTLPFINKIIAGERNVLWKGKINKFAKSSGTTAGKSKYLPVSEEALKNCHFAASKDIMAFHCNHFPESKVFAGKGLIMGGSQKANELSQNSFCGDVSGLMTQNMPFIGRIFYTPKLETAQLENWEEKIDKIVAETINEDVTLIGGVPSWMIVLLNKLLDEKGAAFIKEVWQNLELYIHGGVCFSPYKKLYDNFFKGLNINYLETYNASEGFFAIQDEKENNGLLLMLNYGIFYEFIDVNDKSEKAIELSEVEIDKNYAMLISTNSGLWRYKIGDTVKFTNLKPYRIKITGRTTSFINAFGEELIEENAIVAINETVNQLNLQLINFTVAPEIFNNGKNGKHIWLIELEENFEDILSFSNILDLNLKKINSDYEAKRFNNLVLDAPKIIIAKRGLFYQWLKSKNKLGGQNKVPKLRNDAIFLKEILLHNN